MAAFSAIFGPDGVDRRYLVPELFISRTRVPYEP